ncbi:MAG: hypothetical protein OCU24_06490 [Candidatus Methanospirare jalkutatii]|nr:hypothetical protein [Candidatus Methanospirare jalkutatii]
MRSTHAQVSIDFMIAITILSFGIVLIITQIPMLFAPFYTISTDIHAVAYRTSMILAEDAGIYCENESITSAWETAGEPENRSRNFSFYRDEILNYLSNVRRIGLARNAPVWSSSEDAIPNKLSRRKIEALRDWWNDDANRSMLREKLGLLVSYNGKPVNYSFNISLKGFNNMLIRSAGKPLLQIGYPIPRGVTVERIERIVAIDDCENLGNYTKIGDNECCVVLEICIWR